MLVEYPLLSAPSTLALLLHGFICLVRGQQTGIQHHVFPTESEKLDLGTSRTLVTMLLNAEKLTVLDLASCLLLNFECWGADCYGSILVPDVDLQMLRS